MRLIIDMRSAIRISSAILLLTMAWPATGQDMPPSPVRFTEAQQYSVRRTIQLPGTVESGTRSIVASEVAGIVSKMSAREGDTVRKGQSLADLRTTTLELRLRATRAQLQEAESRLKLAELTLERIKGLFESEVASRQEFDNALYEHAAWQGRAAELQAGLAQVENDLDLCAIRAPFAGLVVVEMTEVGEWIDAGGPVVEMISLDDLEVRVEVPERYFSSLNPGATATVTFGSIPGLTLEGKVFAIVPRADPEARVFPLKVRLPASGGRVGAGMLARVSFPAGDSYRATVVPKDAVVKQGQDQFVYLIDPDEKVRLVPVQTGQGVGAWIVVEGDLQAGARVVTRGNERLRPGIAVAGQPVEYALP